MEATTSLMWFCASFWFFKCFSWWKLSKWLKFGEYDGWCRLWYSSSFNFYSVSWATCGWTLSWWRFCPFLSDGRLLCSSSSTIISASWVKHIVGPNRFGHLLELLEVEQENWEINGKMISNKNEIHVYIERNMWFKTSHQHIKKLTGYL